MVSKQTDRDLLVHSFPVLPAAQVIREPDRSDTILRHPVASLDLQERHGGRSQRTQHEVRHPHHSTPALPTIVSQFGGRQHHILQAKLSRGAGSHPTYAIPVRRAVDSAEVPSLLPTHEHETQACWLLVRA